MTDVREPVQEQAPPSASPVDERRGGSLIGLLILIGLLAWLTIAAGTAWLVIVLSLIVMVFFHELGHFLTARWTGMKATEFFLGFGPRIWSFRRGETEYGLKAIPAGAYVRIIGMSNLDYVEPSDEPRAYRNQPYWQRVLVAAAGSLTHFMLALLLLFMVIVGWGMPVRNWEVRELVPESSAVAIGFEPGDQIVAIDGQTFDDFDEFGEMVDAVPGETAVFLVERDGELVELTGVVGVDDADGTGQLGVYASTVVAREHEGPFGAMEESVSFFGTTAKQAVVGIGQVFSPSGLAGFAGRVFDPDTGDEVASSDGVAPAPSSAEAEEEGNRLISIYGVAAIGADFARQGVADTLLFMALINIFIGVFNLLPVLPFDGGHIVIATYERIRSRNGVRYQADVAKALPFVYAVVMLFVVVSVGALYLDIVDPVTG